MHEQKGTVMGNLIVGGLVALVLVLLDYFDYGRLELFLCFGTMIYYVIERSLERRSGQVILSPRRR